MGEGDGHRRSSERRHNAKVEEQKQRQLQGKLLDAKIMSNVCSRLLKCVESPSAYATHSQSPGGCVSHLSEALQL